MRFQSLFGLGTALLPISVAEADRRESHSLESCPGYEAVNVVETSRGLSADLHLAGEPCNAYGTDLRNLTLEVTYEAGNRLHVKIQDRGNQVYQVPDFVLPRPHRDNATSVRSSKLKFSHTKAPFAFKITRAGSNELLFDTAAKPLVFESQYLRLRTNLPKDPYLYGLGEHQDPLRLKTHNYTRTIFNQDAYGVPEDANLYGAHPFYLDHRANGSHGVFLLNSNGMDVIIDVTPDGQQYLEYNTLGGVFDFWFLAGPDPVDVAQQYGAVVGTPAMQPYWGLGFHQCRYGYRDAFDVAEVVYNYSQANIPLETMWTDIDYMDRRRVFTLDPERFPLDTMRSLVSHLHENEQHYILMVDPAVAYQDYPAFHRGVEDDVFLHHKNGSLWAGIVWPGLTVFPDWFSKNVQKYWTGQFKSFFSPSDGIDIDALWIDMNEPTNFCNFPCKDPVAAAEGLPPSPPPVRKAPRPLPGWPCALQPPGTCKSSDILKRNNDATSVAVGAARRPDALQKTKLQVAPASFHPRRAEMGERKGLPGRDLLFPKYAIHNKAALRDSLNAGGGGLSNRTVHTDVMHQNGLAMYDTHNLYGSMMSTASREAMLARRPKLRPLIITRSTFAGAGSRVGHWLGDNLSTWDKYRHSIRSMLGFTAFYQFSMVGSDVCGFGLNTTEELCARWASLGAFSTFYRNHNADDAVSQEFYLWETVAASARAAIDIRYRLLDYVYTAMYRHSTEGRPAVAPVLFHYPRDRATWALELQYFYGPALLVAPVTEAGATNVSVYLPDDTFYEWHSHQPIRGEAANHTFVDQGLTSIPLLIRSGFILPARAASANTTSRLRRQPFELLVALDGRGRAKGELYLDDGVSLDQRGRSSLIHLSYNNGSLSINGTFGYSGPTAVSKVTVMGAGPAPPRGVRKHTTGGQRKHSKTVDVDFSLDHAQNVKLDLGKL
ncbi:hypothetical protein HIM_09057 [Hirsutella minnesotensis 3608]|uniref:Alpha/beta-glucosidase agdC n=1 Tax=Hirsutella minnesotensis 3608 TaxID=1043627 RepID=A0A0F8A3B1_9HYPO|nr:hypothetical protein HIM_09057 [Hirsutella minnesotensis 3608]